MKYLLGGKVKVELS